jgi:hypothetical protein
MHSNMFRQFGPVTWPDDDGSLRGTDRLSSAPAGAEGGAAEGVLKRTVCTGARTYDMQLVRRVHKGCCLHRTQSC